MVLDPRCIPSPVFPCTSVQVTRSMDSTLQTLRASETGPLTRTHLRTGPVEPTASAHCEGRAFRSLSLTHGFGLVDYFRVFPRVQTGSQKGPKTWGVSESFSSEGFLFNQKKDAPMFLGQGYSHFFLAMDNIARSDWPVAWLTGVGLSDVNLGSIQGTLVRGTPQSRSRRGTTP